MGRKNRRLGIGLFVLMAGIASTVLCRAERPNVIVILADDLGFSDLGCYGSEIPTPNIDALAAHGARFDSFYTSARCCPSRASMITGLHPHQAGIGSFTTAKPAEGKGVAYTGHLLESCVTMAELLHDAGYSTWMVGKWHMGLPGPIDRGFDQFYGFVQDHSNDQWDESKYFRLPESAKPELKFKDFYATEAFTAYALEFLQQARQQDKPYFLYLAHSSPHFPIHAPKADIDRNVPVYRKGWDELRFQRLEKQKRLDLMPESAELPPRSMVPVDKEAIANGYSGERNPAWDVLPKDRQEDLARRMATFAAMVEHVDDSVGRVLSDLRKNGELENTIIFFLSDNGACYEWGPFGFDGQSRRGTTTLHTGKALDEIGQPGTHQSYGSAWANLGNTPLNMYKHFCHEGGIASPLIVAWPEQIKANGKWVRDPTHLIDIVPTVLEATGATYPEERNGHVITPMEGTSLLSAIGGTPIPERSLAFEHQDARGLRRGKWKITWGKRQPTEVTWQLFNLETDRSEQHDLSVQYPELLSQLVKEWEDWAKKVGAEPFYKSENHTSTDSPDIKDRPLKIVAEVEGKQLDGVVLAQGGKEYGYALYFVDGLPAFDVRIKGMVTHLKGHTPITGKGSLVATLTNDTMTLSVNGAEPVSCTSPGLIPVLPKDGLSVGSDDLSAAGNYEPPNAFNGRIVSSQVKTIK